MTVIVMVAWGGTEAVAHCLSQVPSWGLSI